VPDPSASTRRRRRRGLAVSLAALAAAGVLAGCSAEASTFSGRVLDNPFPAPTAELTDTSDQPYSLVADTDKRLTLVFFGYTRCVDVCPAVLGNLAAGMAQLDQAQRDQVDVVFVTSDPDHDTEQVVRDYLDRYDTSFIGLTGDWKTVDAAAQPLAVGLDRTDPGGHTTLVYGIDSDDEAKVYWSQDTTPGQYADDIAGLLGDA